LKTASVFKSPTVGALPREEKDAHPSNEDGRNRSNHPQPLRIGNPSGGMCDVDYRDGRMELIVYLSAFGGPVFLLVAVIVTVRRKRRKRHARLEAGRIGDEHAALALWWEERRGL
jgi:hypothetical protein